MLTKEKLAELEQACKSFAKIAAGIPDNWPGNCCLSFDQRHDGSIYINYFKIGLKGGILIRDWRKMEVLPQLIKAARENEKLIERLSEHIYRLCVEYGINCSLCDDVGVLTDESCKEPIARKADCQKKIIEHYKSTIKTDRERGEDE